MKCPLCGGDIITFGNEWECIRCGNYGSFLDKDDGRSPPPTEGSTSAAAPEKPDAQATDKG